MLLTEDDQFAIAYMAQADRNDAKRAKPIKIYGHRRINIIRTRSDPETPDALIVFQGVNEIYGRLRDQNRALYVPRSEGEARRIVRDASQGTTIIETPLARFDYQPK